MKTQQRFFLLCSIGIFLAAIILITSSSMLKPAVQVDYKTGAPTVVWQAFPTRQPLATATLSANAYYDLIHNAILVRDYQTAKLVLSTAKGIYPDDPYLIKFEVRLALALRDLKKAVDLVWVSIGKDPTDAMNWALASAIFTRADETKLAAQTLATALELDPTLSADLFPERWAVAVSTEDSQMLTKLADEYYIMNPDDPLADYYNATVLLISGDTNIAITLLVDKLASGAQSPAVLWFTLGQAYLARHSYWESVSSLEYARTLYNAGDKSMGIIAGDPEYLLDRSLASAYLGNLMCVQAEELFRKMTDENNDKLSYTHEISQAVICQTPTPTPTHWMLSLQATATPSPN